MEKILLNRRKFNLKAGEKEKFDLNINADNAVFMFEYGDFVGSGVVMVTLIAKDDKTTSGNPITLNKLNKREKLIFNNSLSQESMFSSVQLTAQTDITIVLTIIEMEEAIF